jgi:cytochrome c oxidase subunit II
VNPFGDSPKLIENVVLFPADLGMNTIYLTIIVALAIVITAVAAIAIVWSTKHPEEVDSHSLAKYEKYWVVLILIVFIGFSISTIGLLPYPYAHQDVKPTMTVDVQARQFAWCLSNPSDGYGNHCELPYPIPLNSVVLFNVTSIDVTHGFAVYDSAGAILFQVQVMPNFTNSIMYQFKNPGIYYVRCLEFCGYGHFGMISELNVTSL